MSFSKSNYLVFSLMVLLNLATESVVVAQKSYFPIGGVTRYSDGTYYFAMSGRHYATPGEVVTKSGEVTNCKTDGKKCAQLLAMAAKGAIESDGVEMVDPEALDDSQKILSLVAQYDQELVDLGESKSGIYFRDHSKGEWQQMKFFQESHTRVMKSLKRRK